MARTTGPSERGHLNCDQAKSAQAINRHVLGRPDAGPAHHGVIRGSDRVGEGCPRLERQAVRERDEVACRHGHVFSQCAVALESEPLQLRAVVELTCTTVGA